MIGNPFQYKKPLRIHHSCLEQFQHLAVEALPNETAALLVGYQYHITDLIPVEVIATTDTFSLQPDHLLTHLQSIKAEKKEWLGLIHSHPTMPAQPSPMDTRGWHYPMLSYWILSLLSQPPTLALFRWDNSTWTSYPFQLEKE